MLGRTTLTHRAAKIALVVVIAWTALAGAALLLQRREPWPQTVWVRARTWDVEAGSPRVDMRRDSFDGPAFAGVDIDSYWFGEVETPDRFGLAISRELTDGERRNVRLARMGLLPCFSQSGAGYQATGETRTLDGATWWRLSLFDPEYSKWTVGWWQR